MTDCCVTDCYGTHKAFGFCVKHLRRHRKYDLNAEELYHVDRIQACMICDIQLEEKRGGCGKTVDYDGTDVRGVICYNCKNGLSHFDESPDQLRAAVQYLLDPIIIPEQVYSYSPEVTAENRMYGILECGICRKRRKLKINPFPANKQAWNIMETLECVIQYQNYTCPITGQPVTVNSPLNTYDNLIRGLVGPKVNKGLGYFKSNPDRLLSAMRYLQDPPGLRGG